MAAVSAPAGAVSPCTDAATDSIRRRLLPVLTYFLADDDLYVAVEAVDAGRCLIRDSAF